MGLIKITTDGSFGYSEMTFHAQEHGHAHCINKAMIYLNDMLKGCSKTEKGRGAMPTDEYGHPTTTALLRGL